jgi:hypothetical protein
MMQSDFDAVFQGHFAGLEGIGLSQGTQGGAGQTEPDSKKSHRGRRLGDWRAFVKPRVHAQ